MELFTTALHEAMGPLDRPRYVIPRLADSVRETWLSIILPSIVGALASFETVNVGVAARAADTTTRMASERPMEGNRINSRPFAFIRGCFRLSVSAADELEDFGCLFFHQRFVAGGFDVEAQDWLGL